jgi:cytochrome P450
MIWSVSVADVLTDQLPLFPFRSPDDDPFLPVTDADRRALDGPVSRVRLPTGGWTWLVTRHADVRQLLRSDAFSADQYRPGFPLLRSLPVSSPDANSGGFIRMDGQEHQRLRRMLTAEFMIKNIRRIEPLIGGVVESALDDLAAAGPPADLVTHFALPVPSLVICYLLGVPYADHAFFQQRSRTLLDRSVPPERARDAITDLRDYLGALIETERSAGARGDNLLSRLITERVDTGELAVSELVGMALLLLIAGHETTANMIGKMTAMLLADRSRWERLLADRSLVATAVEEALRFDANPGFGIPRYISEDVRIADQTIATGSTVITSLASANRDECAFSDAGEMVLDRAPNPHLAFGAGPHSCLGQALARVELQTVLGVLLDRLPGLELADPPERLRRREGLIVGGLEELPVRW